MTGSPSGSLTGLLRSGRFAVRGAGVRHQQAGAPVQADRAGQEGPDARPPQHVQTGPAQAVGEGQLRRPRHHGQAGARAQAGGGGLPGSRPLRRGAVGGAVRGAVGGAVGGIVRFAGDVLGALEASDADLRHSCYKGCMLQGVYATRGVCYKGCMPQGVYATRGVCHKGCMLQGVYATRRVCYKGCMLQGVYATMPATLRVWRRLCCGCGVV
eukprot:1786969-Pyramimonas_sp.AAC.2